MRITDTYGMFDENADESGHDQREWTIATVPKLFEHIRAQELRFADVMAEAKSDPECELNTLGPEYLGVAFAVTIEHRDMRKLHLGICPDYWVFVRDDKGERTPFDGPEHGRLVVYFHHWTEWNTSCAYKRETGRRVLVEWCENNVDA